MITNGLGISKNPLNDISKVYLESIAKTPEVAEINEGIRDKDPEKGTKERKARLEKKRGMKVDDHPEYKKGVEAPKEKLKTDRDGYRIPKKDADAARERLLAKAKALRAKKEKDQKKSVNEDAFDPGLVDRKRREQNLPKDKVPQAADDASKNKVQGGTNLGSSSMKQGSSTSRIGPGTTSTSRIGPGTSGGRNTNTIKAKPLATLNRGKKGDGYFGPTLSVGGYRVGIPNPIRKEALDPVGREDGDVNNDGKKDDTDSYLMKRRKAIGKAIKKKKGIKEGHCDEEGVKCSDVEKKKDSKKSMKEGYHNWRQDLIEVMDDVEDQKEVKEKKVNNKIKINPELGEAVEEIGGTLIEMIEVDEMDVLIESVYEELIEEGYSEDDVEEAIEFALTEDINEASDKYYDSAVKASKKAGAKIKRAEMVKKAKGRLRFLGRKAKEKVGSAKKKAGMASAQAQVAAYNKAREVAQTAGDKAKRAKKKVEDAPKKAKRGVKGLLRRAAQKVVDRMSEELSVDDQMKISQKYNRMTPEEKKEANKKVMGKVKKVKREKDTRTDAEKMADATGPRKGSNYRGD